MNWALESPGFYTFHPTFTTIIIINSNSSTSSTQLSREMITLFYFFLLQLFAAVYILFPLCLRARHASRCVNFIFSNFMHHQAPKASTSTHKRAGLDTFQGLFAGFSLSILVRRMFVTDCPIILYCSAHATLWVSLYHAWQGTYGQEVMDMAMPILQ